MKSSTSISTVILTPSLTIKQLNGLIRKIKTERRYLQKDPNDRILLQREDFTNFTGFHKRFKEHRSLQERIFGYDPQFPQEVLESMEHGQEDQNLNRILLRFVYLVIFEVTDYLEGLEKAKKDAQKTASTVVSGESEPPDP